MEYRIQEHGGTFVIQVKVISTRGMLWWKKKIERWQTCNKYGGALLYWPILQQPCETFGTLEEARQRVKLFKQKIRYHQA